MDFLKVDYQNGSYALQAPSSNIIPVVLAANVPQQFAKPAGAGKVYFAKTADFYASYVDASKSELTNLVTNGGFTTDTSWTKGPGWTIAAGVAHSDGLRAGDADISQVPSKIVPYQAYLVTFTVSNRSAGSVSAVIGEGAAGTSRSADGTFSEVMIAGVENYITLRADINFVGDVDNFSAVPTATVPTVTSITGEGSELNPTVREITKISAISLVSAATAIVTMVFSK